MTEELMQLQILLPSAVFAQYAAVTSIVLETPQGAYGLLPNRLDCVAILEPGILTYTVKGAKPAYIVVDDGVLVKVGKQVRVSVRNAHADSDLEQLKLTVTNEFLKLQEQEREVRAVLARLESGFMRGFNHLHPH